MWKFIISVSFIPWVQSQFDRARDDDQSWNIKLAVPGAPGGDYPTLNRIPRTTFTCAGKDPGYYADQEANCQVFKVCTAGSTYGSQSFLCPNGTLFNQAVLVCDWWMNVNCGNTQDLINKSQRLINVQPGPQLIQDVKKMITHPMRNPYDSGFFRNNLVVMQEYRPPSEQFYPNGASINNQERNTNNIYVPYKGLYNNFGQYVQNTNDINFAASTASPQYISRFNSIQDTQRGQYIDYQRSQNANINTIQNSRNGFQTQMQKGYTPSVKLDLPRTVTQSSTQRQTLTQQNQYINTKTPTKQDFVFNKINQSQRPVTQKLRQSTDMQRNNGGKINPEAKQNLVSTEPTPTIISKTIAFKTILPGEKPGSAKSRITFKTWILKPKNAKLIIEPSHKSPNSPHHKTRFPKASENLPSSVEPYVYDVPQKSFEITDQNKIYVNNQPTTSKVISTTPNYYSRLYSPTTFRPTSPSRLYLAPLTDLITTSTTPESLYESPSMYKSFINSYIPPTELPQLSRQYLSPIASQQLQLRKNSKLLAAASSQTPQFELYNAKNNHQPTLATKQSQINANPSNVIFSNEKLDVTVNDIIKRTFNVPKSLKQNEINKSYNKQSNGNFLKSQRLIESKEELTSEIPFIKTKSSKLVAIPSTDLQPPFENVSNQASSNKLSNLPYYKEPTNTIERTVSIKITLPERIAKLLFRNESQTDSNDVEILNTGSSNYLVYANHLASKAGTSLTPIGKLSLIKNSNISNSQDLVFSFLADSLNVAKEYSNIATQNIATTSTPPQQSYRNNNVQGITNKISQLTSTQFANNNPMKQNNIQQFASQSQVVAKNNQVTQFTNNKYQNGYQQLRLQQITTPSKPFTQNRVQATRTQDATTKLQNVRQNQIYSGQLYKYPVPDVTRDYYNSPNSQQKQVINDIEIIPSQQIPFNTYQTSTSQASSNEQNSISTKDLNNLIQSGNGITAQLQDSIVGTLPHPIEHDKFLTYKKDQSYYLFSQLNNNDHENNRINDEKSNTLQFIPSVGYKLNDPKEQQKILNTFKINEFGVPQGAVNGYRNPNQRQDISTDVDYTIDHESNFGDKINTVKSLYDGPPSYTAAQTSYNIENPQAINNNNQNSRIEDLDSNEPRGYPKITPLRKFNT